MEGIITSFRRSKTKTQHYQMIVKVPGVETKEKAEELLGKTISWKSPAGKEIKGKVSAAHGNKGAIRSIFETGMPGQSLGAKVKIE